VANLLALAVCTATALVYWVVFERVPAVAPAQARAMLAETAKPVALVDVRPVAAFAENHLPGAVSWPWEQIVLVKDVAAMPVELQQRRLLLICDSGHLSATAVGKVQSLGITDVWNVRGGMVAWTTIFPGATGDATNASLRPMSTLKQWIVTLTAFVVKPAYLLVSLGVIIVLWRRTETDLTALRWGLIWFWAGEQACTANWIAYGGASDWLEYLHDFGMVTGFAFISWAAMEGMDGRLIHFSAVKERCAALSLCLRCIKYADEPCGFRRIFLFSVPASAVMALLPLTADFKLTSYGSNVLGSLVCYSHTMVSQLFELRFCPVLALALFAASWLVLRFKRNDPVPWSKLLFSAGLGPLGFGTMRMALVATFSNDLMWFETWEEWTELLFVLGVAVVLWIFRHGLLVDRLEASETTAPAAA